MRGKWLSVFALTLLIAFLYALMQLATLPLETGDAYAAYSSMRPDPMGTMALFESLQALPELRVERNFSPLPRLKGSKGTILILGERVEQSDSWSESDLKLWESIAENGARVVIAFVPVPPDIADLSRKPQPDAKLPEIVRRWKIRVERYEASPVEAAAAGSVPRFTYAFLDPQDGADWTLLDENDQEDAVLAERKFGKGTIVLLTESYPLSNEGLRTERDTELIRIISGVSRPIVFDESHLGVSNTGSVGRLIRRYGLTAAFAMMLVLALLFLWKNSTSLLPRIVEAETNVAAGADSQSGLVNLLKRSILPEQLARTSWERWKETRSLGRPVSERRVQRVDQELGAAGPKDSPAALYNRVRTILTEKT